ncbi:hypothetical protein BDB01DRAFT_266695 [Pilobolus umbonatus]|nr:hypothetical protein BDB01DRAFT_266695 [Pilobolus umbonatus]
MNTFLPTRQLCSVPSIFRSVSSIILCREPLLEHTESNDIDVRDIVRKPSDKVYLLVKKPRRNNAWQFPQGGQEKGETKAEAALRELKEECGRDLKVTMSNHTSVGSYQYRFPRCFIAYNKRKYNDAAIGAKV